MTHRIVYLETDGLPPQVMLRRPSFPHAWTEFAHTLPGDAARHLADATIAIVNKAKVSADAIAAAPNLEMISIIATGTDPVDLDACRTRGITVTNVTGYAVNTVPEHAFGLILALRRQIVGFRAEVADGTWTRSGRFCLFTNPIEDLRGKRIGVIGEGELGSAVAAIAENGFGMRAVFLDHPHVRPADRAAKTFVGLDELLETSDVVSVHCPLTPDTHHLLDAAALRRMKPTALVINTARGAVVEEAGLVAAIENGWIGGAGIDVLAAEPPAEDHPYLRLLDRPNFILTPHVAWSSAEGMQDLADRCINNIENYVAGRPTNVVTEPGDGPG